MKVKNGVVENHQGLINIIGKKIISCEKIVKPKVYDKWREYWEQRVIYKLKTEECEASVQFYIIKYLQSEKVWDY